MTHPARALIERLQLLVAEGQTQTAVLWLPDGTLQDFPEYLAADPLQSAICQARVEYAAAEVMDDKDWNLGAFGAVLTASREAGVVPFDPAQEGHVLAMVFDLDADDPQVTVLIQPIRVRGDLVEAKDIVVWPVALGQVPPDTPGLILIQRLAHLRGFLPEPER